MKARGQRRGKGGKKTNNEKFKKLKDSVSDFVKSKGGFDNDENDQRVKFVKRESRKDLRKEKRKLKKAKMKNHYMGQSMAKSTEELNRNTPAVKEENTHKPALKKTADAEHVPQRQQKTKTGNPKTKEGEDETKHKKVHFSEDLPEQKMKSGLNESRKLALLEANVEEDREIKRLEKRLRLNKRKNKKSLPQSFTDDGLDYILGILETGASATGLYDSDDEMDIDKAKENFDELDDDSDDEQMTDEEEIDEGEEEDEAQMEDVEEEDTQIDDEEEEDETDASEENEEAEEAESEQKTPESQELVCH